MRSLAGISFVLMSIAFYSCSQTSTPTSPQVPQIPHPGLPLSLNGYGAGLDSNYYKVWSDSSWEEFYKDTTISGTNYAVILDNSGYENLYGSNGFSGFGQYGGAVVLFDSALASKPDTMLEGTTYTTQTTFSYQGTDYVLIDEETILDTTTVTVPFGTFTDCRVIQSVGSINGVLQYATVYWFAKGPADIERQDYTGYAVTMAYGVVNGQGWGVPLSRELPGYATVYSGTSDAGRKPLTIQKEPGTSIQSLAPMILKGILR